MTMAMYTMTGWDKRAIMVNVRDKNGIGDDDDNNNDDDGDDAATEGYWELL